MIPQMRLGDAQVSDISKKIMEKVGEQINAEFQKVAEEIKRMESYINGFESKYDSLFQDLSKRVEKLEKERPSEESIIQSPDPQGTGKAQ